MASSVWSMTFVRPRTRTPVQLVQSVKALMEGLTFVLTDWTSWTDGRRDRQNGNQVRLPLSVLYVLRSPSGGDKKRSRRAWDYSR